MGFARRMKSIPNSHSCYGKSLLKVGEGQSLVPGTLTKSLLRRPPNKPRCSDKIPLTHNSPLCIFTSPQSELLSTVNFHAWDFGSTSACSTTSSSVGGVLSSSPVGGTVFRFVLQVSAKIPRGIRQRYSPRSWETSSL